MAAHSAHTMMQEDVCGARRPRAAIGSDYGIGGQRDFYLLGFKPLVEEFGSALRKDFDEGGEIFPLEAAQLRCYLKILDEIPGTARRELRRRGEEERLHHPRDAFQPLFEGRIDFGIML